MRPGKEQCKNLIKSVSLSVSVKTVPLRLTLITRDNPGLEECNSRSLDDLLTHISLSLCVLYRRCDAFTAGKKSSITSTETFSIEKKVLCS